MRFAMWSTLALASVALAMPATGQTGTATLQFEDQTSHGTSVTVASVDLPDDGFVVIYNGTGTTEVLGHSELLPAGNHTDVDVSVQNLTQNMTITASLHQDTDGDGDFAVAPLDGTDIAYGVSDSAFVTVQPDAAPAPAPLPNETEGAQPREGDEVGEPETETPAPGLAALLAVIAAAVVLRRR